MKFSFYVKLIILNVITVLLFGEPAFSQNQIEGVVISEESNLPLMGVTVQIKNTNVGTLTDDDGRFVLVNASESDSIIFSNIGFKSQTIPVVENNFLTVKMISEASSLNQLVIVGYGTQKKINLTGAVDVVNSETFEGRPSFTVADMIKGASPNLTIDMGMRGGEPGVRNSWNLRGIGSINGSSAPLILIDGMEGDVQDLDPQSIESISILKDASASAIYGSRAAFGVILITTKSGSRDGKVKIQYNNNLSWSAPIRVPSYIDSYTWAVAYNQASRNAGIADTYSEEQMERIKGYLDGTFGFEYDPENPIDNIWGGRRDGNANNDWPRILLADYSFSQKHQMNISGGNDNTQYYVAGDYIHQNGMYRFGYDYYERYSFTANLSTKVTDWLTFSPKIKYGYSNMNYPLGETTVNREHQFREMIKFGPMMPFYNLNGSIQSPLVRQQQGTGRDKTRRNDVVTILAATIEPIKGWRTDISYNFNFLTNRNTSNPKPIPVELGTGGFGNVGKPIAGVETSMYESEYQLANIVSSYEINLGDHFIKPMIGYEQEYKNYTSISASGQDLIIADLPSLSTALGEKTVNDRRYEWGTKGYFGRINYSFRDKYLFEVSGRYNASSRFSKNSRWGFFPSGSVGYVISSEDFWDPIKPYVNTFKIRGSYGSLGNQNVSNYYSYLSTIPINSELDWIIGQERPSYANAPSLISGDLTWETIRTLDIGIDAGFLNNRLDLTFDWYRRVTSDMLGPSISLPSTLGASAPQSNNAKMETKGFELTVGWQDKISKDFGYSVKVALGDNKSRILDYENEKGLIDTWYKGKEVGEIWGYVSDGLIQEVGEMMPDQSKFYATWGPGDMKYIDVNDDGVIDDGDRTLDSHGDLAILGNVSPRYNLGINLGLTWKSFDFNMFWQGVLKRDWYPDVRSTTFWGFDRAATGSGLYQHSPSLDYWRPIDEDNILGPNTEAYLPKPYFSVETNKNREIQSRYILSGGYMRLKNLQIGFSLPSDWLNGIFIKNARLYFSGENLFVITRLPGDMDPETAFASHPDLGGYEASGVIYPISRNLSLGLNITF